MNDQDDIERGSTLDDTLKVFAKYQDAIFNRLIRSGIPEDIAHEAIAMALEKIVRLCRRPEYKVNKEEKIMLAFLYRVIQHSVYDFFRKEQQDIGRREIYLPWGEPTETSEEKLLLRERRKQVRRIMAEELTEPHQQILEMRVFREMVYSEIAAELNITITTARKRMSRAMRSLAAAVKGEDALTEPY